MKTEPKSNSKNNIEVLFADLERVRENLRIAKEAEKSLVSEILGMYENGVGSARTEKGDPFGVVHVEDGEYILSFTTPKKVTWDQKGLAALYSEGAPVDVEYHVSEATYKAFDEAAQAYFIPHRSVSPGAVTVKIERSK